MYIITFDGDLPYRGVACDRAGIALGKYYKTKEAALKDFALASKFSRLPLRVAKYEKT